MLETMLIDITNYWVKRTAAAEKNHWSRKIENKDCNA